MDNQRRAYLAQLQQQQTPVFKLIDQKKETVINQFKINTYYSFSQSSFQHKETLIEKLITEFDQQINSLIKSVYLTLTLREIHETRKWNNLLFLKENQATGEATSSQEGNSETTDDSVDSDNK